jgi:hypothetical protein
MTSKLASGPSIDVGYASKLEFKSGSRSSIFTLNHIEQVIELNVPGPGPISRADARSSFSAPSS